MNALPTPDEVSMRVLLSAASCPDPGVFAAERKIWPAASRILDAAGARSLAGMYAITDGHWQP